MKRRDFLKASVGAGVAVSTPFAGSSGVFVPLSPQEGRTLYDKIWDSHVVANLGGDTDLLAIDRNIIMDGGPGSVMGLLEERLTIAHPELHWTVCDHYVSTSPNRYTNRSLNIGSTHEDFVTYAEELREMGIQAFGIDDPQFGIQHVVGPETGLTQPGMLVVGGDSHTATHGAMGCVSWGGSGGAGLRNVLRTGTVIRTRAKRMRITIEGTLGPWVRAKDVSLYVIGQLGAAGGNGYAVEYAGPVVRAMSMDSRLTLCNLNIEMSSTTGMVAPDDTTYEYLAGREFAPPGPYWDQALRSWRSLPSDPDVVFDREETIDMSSVEPQVTWGVNSEHVVGISERVPDPDDAPAGYRESVQAALDYTGLTPGNPIAGTPIDEVFIGSCTESRIDDLRAAAEVVAGRQVAPNVIAWVIAGAMPIKRQAEAEGLDRIFTEAGFEWREPGCSKCIGMNGEHVAPGNRAVSNSNRNFIGRQGRDSITHLASTPMAAAAAIAGRIVDVRRLMQGEPV
jgi:3-isopropylmalate/(R)-2-methylmalate dehydratase large subunit